MSNNSDAEPNIVREEEIESRAGEMTLQYIEDERRRLVIMISRRELQVVQHCGLLFRHPFDDGFIYFGPWQDVGECPGITRCLATKNTEADLTSGMNGVYDHDDHVDIEFRLASAEPEYPEEQEGSA